MTSGRPTDLLVQWLESQARLWMRPNQPSHTPLQKSLQSAEGEAAEAEVGEVEDAAGETLQARPPHQTHHQTRQMLHQNSKVPSILTCLQDNGTGVRCTIDMDEEHISVLNP